MSASPPSPACPSCTGSCRPTPARLLAWTVAVLIRLATGSATVTTVTASGILAPLVDTLSTGETSLLVPGCALLLGLVV